jgi:hypothetical protein
MNGTAFHVTKNAGMVRKWFMRGSIFLRIAT